MQFSLETLCTLVLNYFSLIYNLCEIIKELSFVFAKKPLSKNKETRTREPDVPTICYEISLISARSFTHNQYLYKGPVYTRRTLTGVKLNNN